MGRRSAQLNEAKKQKKKNKKETHDPNFSAVGIPTTMLRGNTREEDDNEEEREGKVTVKMVRRQRGEGEGSVYISLNDDGRSAAERHREKVPRSCTNVRR